MGRILNVKDFQSALENSRSVETNEVNIRKLINLLSESRFSLSDKEIEFIKSINSNVFLGAYHELNKPIEKQALVKDLVVTEYARDNLNNSDYFISEEEEIY